MMTEPMAYVCFEGPQKRLVAVCLAEQILRCPGVPR